MKLHCYNHAAEMLQFGYEISCAFFLGVRVAFGKIHRVANVTLQVRRGDDLLDFECALKKEI